MNDIYHKDGHIMFTGKDSLSIKQALEKAVENGVNLYGADLSDAILYGADLHGADLHGANLYNAKGVISGGFDSRGYHFLGIQQNKSYKIQAGCRWFTPEEALAHWSKEHEDNLSLRKECLSRINIIAELALDKGWFTYPSNKSGLNTPWREFARDAIYGKRKSK